MNRNEVRITRIKSPVAGGVIDFSAATIDAVWDEGGHKSHVVHDQAGHVLGTFEDARLGLLFLEALRALPPAEDPA